MAKTVVVSLAGALVAFAVERSWSAPGAQDPGVPADPRPHLAGGRRGRRSSSWRARSRCGSVSCALSSGSWWTSSAGAAAHDRARRPPPAGHPRRPATRDADPAAWDAFVEANPRGSYLQLGGWARVKAVNGWSARRLHDPGTDERPRGRCPGAAAPPGCAAVGLRLRPARARARPLGRGVGRPVHARWPRPGSGRRGRVSHLRIDPEIERDAGPDEGGAVVEPGCGAAGWREAPPIQPVSHAGHRPGGRRGRPVGRPAQEVAPVRQQGPGGRRSHRGRGAGAPGRVLPDLPRDGGPGGVPDPRPVRVPRRVGRLRAGRPCPPPVRASCPTATPVGDAVPRARPGPASWSRTAA